MNPYSAISIRSKEVITSAVEGGRVIYGNRTIKHVVDLGVVDGRLVPPPMDDPADIDLN